VGLLRLQRRWLLSTGRLSLPWILCLRGKGVSHGRRLGGKLGLRRELGCGRCLRLRSDLVR
jgi:hypothetical protein